MSAVNGRLGKKNLESRIELECFCQMGVLIRIGLRRVFVDSVLVEARSCDNCPESPSHRPQFSSWPREIPIDLRSIVCDQPARLVRPTGSPRTQRRMQWYQRFTAGSTMFLRGVVMGVCRQQGRRKTETQPQPNRSRSNCQISANTLLAF